MPNAEASARRRAVAHLGGCQQARWRRGICSRGGGGGGATHPYRRPMAAKHTTTTVPISRHSDTLVHRRVRVVLSVCARRPLAVAGRQAALRQFPPSLRRGQGRPSGHTSKASLATTTNDPDKSFTVQRGNIMYYCTIVLHGRGDASIPGKTGSKSQALSRSPYFGAELVLRRSLFTHSTNWTEWRSTLVLYSLKFSGWVTAERRSWSRFQWWQASALEGGCWNGARAGAMRVGKALCTGAPPLSARWSLAHTDSTQA